MRCVIFANGKLNLPANAESLIQAAVLIIAADGGARHCRELGITPDVVIGDFDSLEPEALERYRDAGIRVIPHPARKDQTDLELALGYALEQGANEALILGGLGGRLDQSLASLLLPANPAMAGLRIRLLDGPQSATALHGGERLRLEGSPGDTVSLLPLTGDALGVTTSGLEYPLENGDLRFGSTRGVSNVLVRNQAEVRLSQGILMCIHIRGETATDR